MDKNTILDLRYFAAFKYEIIIKSVKNNVD